jgi:F-type H+-transporting ATPase subunit b
MRFPTLNARALAAGLLALFLTGCGGGEKPKVYVKDAHGAYKEATTEEAHHVAEALKTLKDTTGEDAPVPMYVREQSGAYRPATYQEVKEFAESDKLGFLGLKRYDLGIWTLVVFGILMFILSKFAWPHMREGLAKREANIKSALEEARQAQQAARAEFEKAKQELAKAALEVRAMIEEARRDAEVLKASEREVGVKEAAAERERARRDTEALKDALLKELYEQTVKLAALMSEKALRRAVSAEDHRRLLDESIAELKAGGKA